MVLEELVQVGRGMEGSWKLVRWLQAPSSVGLGRVEGKVVSVRISSRGGQVKGILGWLS